MSHGGLSIWLQLDEAPITGFKDNVGVPRIALSVHPCLCLEKVSLSVVRTEDHAISKSLTDSID